MPSILFAHDGDDAGPLVTALKESGWTVVQRSDPLAVLSFAQSSAPGAALVDEGIAGGAGIALAEELRQGHANLPVVLLTRGSSPALEAHRAGPRPASAWVERAQPAEKIAAEVRRAVRTIPSSARPTTGATLGQHAVLAALRELDQMKPSQARLPTPEGVRQARAPQEAALEAAQARVRELEQEKLALLQVHKKAQAEHQLALSTREDMVRHLELALEALTRDLTSAATGIAEQQDLAGARADELQTVRREQARVQQELAAAAGQAKELRRELGEARALLLGAELDTAAAREALGRAMTEASAAHVRALEAEAQRADLIRALTTARAQAEEAQKHAEQAGLALVAVQRDAQAAEQAHQDEVQRIRRKLQAAERALEDAAHRAQGRAAGHG